MPATTSDIIAEAKPALRYVVVGTPGAIAGVSSMLESARIAPLGAIIVGPEQASGSLAGIRILGTINQLEAVHGATPFSLALAVIPSSMSEASRRAREALAGLGVAVQSLPTMDDLLTEGAASIGSEAQQVDLGALIGRTPRPIDHARVRRLLAGRRVLITGAGGSIGSELARLCAGAGPSQLVLMDRSENALFELDRELASRFPDTTRTIALHDVVDRAGTLRRFRATRPEVVFHAAAHKHVPLMEDHPVAALQNNLFGTRSVCDAAIDVGARHSVMISTDKAVNPTSVMGATKLLAERYVRGVARRSGTKFSIVRFGNVLGSACSVLPIWESQILEGGPVTITDPAMTRFFMTIGEAAALVIQAATIEPAAAGADTFVLDMGEPVRITDLAERYLRSRGFEPQWDGGTPTSIRSMPIRVTGARPGEKIHEQLAHDPTGLTPTRVPGVLRLEESESSEVSPEELIRTFEQEIGAGEPARAIRAISRCVPTLGRRETTSSAA